ncbi:MAG TPA: hypothetical protein VK452_09615 [Dissulfurispiraceae bacterium]|nr:hypothetical protein [Dissulfurispiraceae bacterium]
MKKGLCFFILSLSALLANTVQAFDIKGLQPVPPYGVFSTFSAESLKQNQIGAGIEMERSIDPDFYRASLKGAYGLHDKFEILFTLPYIFANKDTGDGIEDVSLGVKHRLLDESDYFPAFAYLLTVSIPSDNDKISTDGRVGGGLLLTKKIGPFKGHMNLLYIVPGRSELHNEYDLNLGTELAVTHSSKILAELIGRKDFEKGKLNLLEWRLGYRVATADNIFTTIGAGWNFKNRTPDLRLMFSVSVILPFQKPKIQKVYED